MSALLIYKQYFKEPNKKSTASKNAAHIRYIGNRPGVMKEAGAESGLFGRIGGHYKDVISITEACSHAKAHSERKMNVYRSIISFSAEEAYALHLNTLSDWKSYVKRQIYTIAQNNGIRFCDIEWTAAVHDKHSHPHVHIAFWDKEQKIQKQFISPKIPDRIRCELIKNTYPQLYQEYVANKNMATLDMKNVLKDVVYDYEQYLKDSDILSLLNEVTPLKTHNPAESITKTDIRDMKQFDSIIREICRIRQLLPRYGSLKYEYLPPNVKAELQKLTGLILRDERLCNVVDRYINSRVNLMTLYTSNAERLENAEMQYLSEAEKLICNSLLKIMKGLDRNNEDLHFDNGDYSSEVVDETVSSLITLFHDISRVTHHAQARYNKIINSSPESKSAKLEALRKAKDKGIGIEI